MCVYGKWRQVGEAQEKALKEENKAEKCLRISEGSPGLDDRWTELKS